MTVGKTETLPPGSQAYVRNSGNPTAAVFDFGIPRGVDGGGGGGGDTIPVGSIFPYVGTTAPSGWMMCDGTEVSSSAYPALAALLAPFGGKTPDLRNRFPMGAGAQALGATGGSNTIDTVVAHTHTVSGSVSVADAGALSLTGSVDTAPAHIHTIAPGQHTHSGGGRSHTHSIGPNSASLSGNHSHGGAVIDGTTGSNTSTGGSAARITALSKGSVNTETSHSHGISGDSTMDRDALPAPSYYPTTGASYTLNPAADANGSHSHALSGSTTAHGHTGSLSGAQATSTGSATVDITNPFLALNFIIKAA